MYARATTVLFGGIAIGLAGGIARADDIASPSRPPSFTTLAITPLPIEGLTGDRAGNLYAAGRDAAPAPCPVWKFDPGGSRTTVGFLPNPAGCGPAGIAFDEAGDLYVADGATVWRLTPSASQPPLATAFATGVPGTNGLAFDRHGNLWTGDGGTGQGRVWRIDPDGGTCEAATGAFTGCAEVFRVQPMRNGTDLGGTIAAPGVGRGNNPVPANTPQNLVANGVAFNREGDL
ncbi:MAG TPA: hypothetical protein VFT22_13100, partial [Kofleriaceae bacterium]|nr:hypothetical protein [Kofleriaceae bacterium]